jgi:hypothetical protein
MTEAEREAVVEMIAKQPDAGVAIEGTGGARKVRFVARGRGKSGGYRVVRFYSGPDIPVFLLAVYAKGEKANLTEAERNELKGILREIVEEYRTSGKRHA